MGFFQFHPLTPTGTKKSFPQSTLGVTLHLTAQPALSNQRPLLDLKSPQKWLKQGSLKFPPLLFLGFASATDMG